MALGSIGNIEADSLSGLLTMAILTFIKETKRILIYTSKNCARAIIIRFR